MSATRANLRIQGPRLWQSLMDMALIGGTPKGGCNRQTLTEEDRQGRALFAQWCEAAGLPVSVDSMGNQFATRPGSDPDASPVLLGSHLDTQPTGGKYDGILGVLAGLEVARTLNDLGIRTCHPIAVVNWTNEEGTRFAPAMLASGVFAGVHTQQWAYAQTDRQGTQFGEALALIGAKGDEPVGQRPVHAYLELHIEQGPILEVEGHDIGVVTAGQGLVWLRVTLTGRESHTGTTPMPRRLDALRGAAQLVERVHAIAMAEAPNAVATVGELTVHPNSRNIIPGEVALCIDLRNPDAERLAAMEAAARSAATDIAEALGLTVAIEPIGGYQPVPFDPDLVATVRRAAETLGYSHRDIISGAGHDACYLAQVAPTAMIFCPCVDGLSHNEAEEIHPHWATAGADVLLHAALEVAGIVE